MVVDLQSAVPEPVEVAGVSYARGDLAVLQDIDVAIGQGQRLAVIGPSGCGKSTLLSLIAGLLEPAAGAITVGGGRSPADRLARCALMPQRDLLLPWRSALDNAGLALENAGVRRSDARRQAAPLFEQFGLAEFESTSPAHLSGGMRQRVAFLRTLLAGKPVLLLDEPFGALDAITRLELQDWLVEALEAEPRTVVLVTHDVDEALKICPRVVALSQRPARVVLDAPSDEVTRDDVLGALRS
jgi:NitT/TauT family transport system ATP-binding protein